MFAVFRNQKLSLAQYVRHTGANFVHRIVFAVLQLPLVNRMARAAFEIDVCQLDAIFTFLRLSEAQTCKWTVFATS